MKPETQIMQASQSVPSNAFRPAHMPQAAAPRTPQPAARSTVVPLPVRTESAELDRVVDLGYN
ncbi:hypothetical protein [Denitromonas iodatirespirans]|uniref:Uncharacterized protein n=1 Tax=Denitromonas iodatirespirans TaxID=2795389 RepID=A0A944H9V3_DENI1|nr:hypothetical protein [Denitromonas iodatirespirans]MBT0963848.1 hypothetical protein [Denitromonas iodatirespirans]